MCSARSRFASSMKGRFSESVSSFHSAPRRLLISELCIFGFSCAICRRWARDQTMKAFIGRFTWSEDFDIMTVMMEKKFCISLPMLEFFFLSESVSKQVCLKLYWTLFLIRWPKKCKLWLDKIKMAHSHEAWQWKTVNLRIWVTFFFC